MKTKVSFLIADKKQKPRYDRNRGSKTGHYTELCSWRIVTPLLISHSISQSVTILTINCFSHVSGKNIRHFLVTAYKM